MKKKVKPSLPIYVFGDVVAFVFSVFPGVFAWAASLMLSLEINQRSHWTAAALAFPVFLMFTFSGICAVLCRLLPRLKPGFYDLDSKMIKVWYCHFQLGNALYVSGLQPLMYCSNLGKFLYLRAMGADVKYGILCNHLTKIRDFQLVKIGRNCSLSANTHIACHTYVDDKLFLGKVDIGDDVFVGMDVLVGPRTILENGSYVGMGNRIYRKHLKAGERIENFQFHEGMSENKAK